MRAEIKELPPKAARASALAIYRNLVDNPDNGGTPVDTGYARASWNLSAGSPKAHLPAAERDPKAKYSPKPVTLSKPKAGEDIFITNAVPYIVFLNEGSSDQAPQMFIQRAIESATGQKPATFEDD